MNNTLNESSMNASMAEDIDDCMALLEEAEKKVRKGSFILERKGTRNRLEWSLSFPMHVFILSSGKNQREFMLSFSRSR